MAMYVSRTIKVHLQSLRILPLVPWIYPMVRSFGSQQQQEEQYQQQEPLPNLSSSSKPRSSQTLQESNHHQASSQEQPELKQQRLYWWQQAQLYSLPNLITISRMATAPLLSYWIITQQHDMALLGCVLAGASDVLDGYLAKHHGMGTVLGTYMDPLADKLIINVLSISLWHVGTLSTPLVALWLARDVSLLVGGYLYLTRRSCTGAAATSTTTSVRSTRADNATTYLDLYTSPLKVNPTLSSKINTGFQFATLSLGILCPLYPKILWLGDGVMALSWISGCTTIASGFSYWGYTAFSESDNSKDSTSPPR